MFSRPFPSRNSPSGCTIALTAPRDKPRAVSISTPSSSASRQHEDRARTTPRAGPAGRTRAPRQVDRRQHLAQRELIHARRQIGSDQRRQELRSDEQSRRGERIVRLAVDEYGERHEADVVADRIRGIGEEQAPERRDPQRCEVRPDGRGRVSGAHTGHSRLVRAPHYAWLRVRLLTADYGGGDAKSTWTCRIGQVAAAGRFCDRCRHCFRLAADWTPISLFVLLLALAVLSEPFRLETKNFYVSDVVPVARARDDAAGPTPAACLGVRDHADQLADPAPRPAAVDGSQTCRPTPASRSSAEPLSRCSAGRHCSRPSPATFVLLVFSIFMVTNAVNFLLIAVDFRVFDRSAGVSQPPA